MNRPIPLSELEFAAQQHATRNNCRDMTAEAAFLSGAAYIGDQVSLVLIELQDGGKLTPVEALKQIEKIINNKV